MTDIADTDRPSQEAPEKNNPGTTPTGLGPLSARTLRITGTLRRTLLIAVLFYPVGLAFYLNLIEPTRHTVAIDFVAFWAAAQLLVQGSAISAFDFPTLQAMQLLPESAADAMFAWLYPPTFHVLIAPFGYFTFTPAFFLFTAVATGAYCLALRPWVQDDPIARDLSIGAPAVATVVFTGNTSLLWAAAFLAAMHGLSNRNALQAGIFIALLTMKPQLGILIPVALLAGRHWGTILWASLFAVVLNASATAYFGLDYWAEFYRAIHDTNQRHIFDSEAARTMVTWYAFLRRFGIDHETATLIQLLPSALGLAAVALVWSRKGASPDLKIATLLLGTLTATPYAYQYESVLALLAALFLLRAGVGATQTGRLGLFLLWLLPLPGRVTPGLHLAQYAAPVIAAALAYCVALALRDGPRAQTA